MTIDLAFITYGYGKDNLGLGRSSWHLIKELTELGLNTEVHYARTHLKYMGPPVFYLKTCFKDFRKYDIVHSNEGTGVLVYHPRMVETYHHNYKEMVGLNNRIFSKVEHCHCKRMQKIIVPSISTKMALARNGFPLQKINYIPHGVDNKVFQKLANRDELRKKYNLQNKFVAINVGQLVFRKNQIECIKALAGIKNAVLILVGEGPEENKINRASYEWSVPVIHFKNITDRELVELYNISDIYLNTSILEGFGLTLLEAMSCKVPIIAYDTADFRSIIGDSGIILAKDDLAGARAAIVSLKENENLRESLSESAFIKSKDYKWENVAKQHNELYKRMLLDN
jgi:glycosyltransferase involved in cell wall biosynthesis